MEKKTSNKGQNLSGGQDRSPFPSKVSADAENIFYENRKTSPYLREVDKGELYPIPKLVGAYRTILVDQDNMGAEEITFGLCQFDPGSFHEKHAHADCEEIMYILSGKGIGGVGDSETIQQAGDVIFVPRNGVHWFYNPYDEPLVQLFLYTRPSLKKAGYSLESDGYKDISSEVEQKQKSQE